MRRALGLVCLLGVVLGGTGWAQRGAGLEVEHGRYTVRLLLQAVGTEEYSVTDLGGQQLRLQTKTVIADRGRTRSSAATLTLGDRYAPVSLRQESAGVVDETTISGGSANVREGGATRTMRVPGVAFTGFRVMPAAVTMMLMRYWEAHGRPARLPVLRVSEKALPLAIQLVGYDAFQSQGRMVRLKRYTIANQVWGREVLWMNDSGRLAAVMTFAGGLPMEEVLDQYAGATGQLEHSAVEQELLNLADLGREVPVEAQGTYAISGVRLIDGTGRPAVEDATVVVRAGRIASVGTGAAPAGMRVVREDGKTLLPGLWEMHVHYSGVEFGPALLAAGVTTARDLGGELEFLTAVRRAIQSGALGPRLLLAGLIDAGGASAFGTVDAETPEQGVTAVDEYADRGFVQIKVYDGLSAEVLRAVTAEAHRRGLTVTGHVPRAVDAFGGVADGMDMINHLGFVTAAMREPGAAPGTPVDVGSERAKRLIALLVAKRTVVDPTVGWGEMASHPADVDVASFEPGILHAPYTLQEKFQALGRGSDDARWKAGQAEDLKVLRALIAAGVRIVPGTDTGLPGYGLDRELELYVQAGMTPMQAIVAATSGSAEAMGLSAEVGTIAVGKRADMVLVEGRPDEEIRALRRVSKVVTAGRMYDSAKMGASVGFTR